MTTAAAFAAFAAFATLTAIVVATWSTLGDVGHASRLRIAEAHASFWWWFVPRLSG
jgi:hypothetical protein